MFSKLKLGFWYWVKFSSTIWSSLIETFLIAKYSGVVSLQVCNLWISKNLSCSLALIT